MRACGLSVAALAAVSLGPASFGVVEPQSEPRVEAGPGAGAVRADRGVHRFAFGLEQFDVRTDDALVKAEAARKLAASPAQAARLRAGEALKAAVQGLAIDYHEAFGSPLFVRSLTGLLTDPAPARGRAAPDALEVVRGFAMENAPLFRVGDAHFRDALVTRDAVSRNNGVRTIWLQQRIDGVEVVGSELRASVTADGRLVCISSTMLTPPREGFARERAALDRQSAIRRAAESIGVAIGRPLEGKSARADARNEQWFARTPELQMDVRTKFVYFPLDSETVRPAYEVWVGRAGSSDVYEVTIDAASGAVLARRNLTLYAGTQPATYNVFTGRSPAPMSPGPSTPTGAQGAPVERELITTISLDPFASPFGWLTDGATETVGNNVDAHADVNADNAPDLPRPSSPTREFDFPLDFGLEPAMNKDAAIVQLFYTTNWYHDRLHQLGFTEEWGNFQMDNLGRGGLGGDPVQAQAQDGAGFNNANFSSFADGVPGRMQMYLWSGPDPDRDGAFDTEIVVHELTHGTSTRLHGLLSGIQASGMGEGWSDFFALSLLSHPTDDPHALYGMGGYGTFLGGGTLTDNYYFGIRRFPYSTDFSKSPLTYADIDAVQFGFDSEIPRNPVYGPSNPLTSHNVGEIWCSALWQCRANLIGAMGHAGNEEMMQLVIDGMKLSPASPNFIIARDAILLADMVNNDGANRCLLWAGFAARGLGASAVGVPPNLTEGVVESFEVPAGVSFSFPDGAPDASAPGAIEFDVRITPPCAAPVDEGSEQLFISTSGGPFVASALTPTGDGFFRAAIGGLTCGKVIRYYVGATVNGVLFTNPPGAPATSYALTTFTDEADSFADAMETDSGWIVGGPDDNATTGQWIRVDPVGTAAQPEDDHTVDGTDCWVTGQGAVGGALGAADVDNGITTLTSPAFDCTGGEAYVSYWRWFSNDQGGDPNADSMPVELSNDDGVTWTLLELVNENANAWVFKRFRVADYYPMPSSQVRIRFVARDLGAGSLVEAGVDDLRVVIQTCVPGLPADLDGDGHVGASDLASLLGSWGPCPDEPGVCPADFDGDGQVGASDLATLLGSWG